MRLVFEPRSRAGRMSLLSRSPIITASEARIRRAELEIDCDLRWHVERRLGNFSEHEPVNLLSHSLVRCEIGKMSTERSHSLIKLHVG